MRLLVGDTRNNAKRNKDTDRRVLDADDGALVDKEVAKHTHPLEDKRSHLYNPVTSQIAPEYVNVADSLLIGERMAECYSASLPGGFYSDISCPIKTLSDAIKSKRNRDKPAIDLENTLLFCSIASWPEKTEA